MNLPNKLTVLRVLLIPFFVASLLFKGGEDYNFIIIALIIFAVAALTDTLDGMIARKYNHFLSSLFQIYQLMKELGKIRGDIYGLQSHLSENPKEVEWVRELCSDSDGYLDAYNKRGNLNKSKVDTVMEFSIVVENDIISVVIIW